MVVGSVRIGTDLDNKGVEQGVKGLGNSLDRIKKAFDGLNNASSNAFNSKAFNAAKRKYEENKIAIDSVRYKMLELEQAATNSGDATSKAFSKATTDIKQTEAELDAVWEKIAALSESKELQFADFLSGDNLSTAVEASLASDKEYQKLMKDLDRVNLKLEKQKIKQEDAKQAAIDSSGTQSAEYRKLESKLENLIVKQEQYKSRMDAATKETSRASDSMNRFGGAVKKTAREMQNSIKHSNEFGKSIFNLGKRVKRLLVAAFVFNVLRRALRSLVSYMGNALKTNQEFTASLAKIKGNLLTAFQPIYDIAIPALNVLMSALVKVTGYLAAFISMLFGKSVSASQGAAKGLYDQAKAFDAVGSAAKKAKKSLLSFDEVEVLNTDNDSGGGAGKEVLPDFSAEMESLDIFDRIKASLLDFWAALDPTKEALGRLWEQLKIIGGFVWQGLVDFYKSFLEPVGAWTLGEGLPRFVDIITKTLQEIDWQKINDGLHELWLALTPFSIKVGEGLLQFMDNVLRPLSVWTMSEVVPRFLSLLATAVNLASGAIDAAKPAFLYLYNNLLKPLAQWTGGKVLDALDELKKHLNTISTWIKEHQASFDRFGENIGELAGQFWALLEPIADTSWDIFKEKLDKIAENILKISIQTLDLTSSMVALVSSILAIIDKIGALDSWLSKLQLKWDFLKIIATTAIDLIGAKIAGFMAVLKNLLDFFTNIFTLNFKGAIESLFEAFKSWGSSILGIFATVGNGIISIFEKAINWIIERVNSLIEKVNSIKIAGLGLSLPTIPTANIPRIPIPALASGAVLPPNQPFYAMLGDQRHGRNLEAPEGLMRQIVGETVRAELASLEIPTPQIIMNATPDMAALAQIIFPALKRQENIQGMNLVTGGAF